jgi:hypothetical protein
MGYKPFKLAATSWGNFTRTIEMEVKYTQLGEVTIRAKKNNYKDSVALRQEYAKQFNFRGRDLTRSCGCHPQLRLLPALLLTWATCLGLSTKNIAGIINCSRFTAR